MKDSSIPLKIMCWVEIVVSARVLLFTIPVILNKALDGSFFIYNMSDWFVVIATALSVMYIAIGVVSLIGSKWWKIFHFLACASTFIITAGIVRMLNATQTPHATVYFMPLIFSVALVLIVLQFKGDVSPKGS